MRLLERNLWGDEDVWKGKKKKYIVEIETPFRKNHKDFGKFTFNIITPTGKYHNSSNTKIHFLNFEDCYEYVVRWIDDQLIK